MQYEIKDTVGFPVMANVDTPLRKLDADGVTAHTVETISAGQKVGLSSGISKELTSATKGTITIIHLQDDGYGGGDLWADLSKVYFTTDFGFGEDEIKHSVKGSANYDKNDTDKVSRQVVADNNTTIKETRDKIIDLAKKGLDTLGGKDTTGKTDLTDKTNQDLTQKGINWQPIIKWGLIGLAVVGTICLVVYLVKDKPDVVNQANPKNDVPTLQGVNIPIPKNLT